MSRGALSPQAELEKLLQAFERIYLETGAGGSLQLVNPETGDETDVELTYRPGAGLFVTHEGGRPVRIFDAPIAVRARAAQNLPELAERLDPAVATIESEIVQGLEVLGHWLDSRGVGGT